MSSLIEFLQQVKEEAASGATSAHSIATNQHVGFSNKKSKNSKKRKIIRRNHIKNIFTEDINYDKQSVIAQIKNSENKAEADKDVVGFALEDEDENIVKIFVKREQAEEFQTSLTAELSKNQSNEHSHREIGEIIYDLKNNFDIVNIQMGSIPEDEEEVQEVQSSDSESDLELGDDDNGPDKERDGPDKDHDDDKERDDDMEPLSMDHDNLESSSGDESVKSALDSVIDMMKADADARKAEAEAKQKESEAKIAELNTKSAEAHVKKSEEIMDMEAHYDKKSSKEKESKQLAKLAKYKHEINQDETEANTDFVETDIADENEEVKVSGNLLNAALHSLLRDRNSRN